MLALSRAGFAEGQSATDVITAMNAHNKRVFLLSVISTAAVAISAMFTLYRTTRLLKREFGKRKKRS